MIRFFRLIFGYVLFSFEDGFAEGFLNTCFERKLSITDIKRTDTGIIAECPLPLFDRVNMAAKDNGGTLNVIKKRGVFLLIKRLNLRFGLIVGALIFVFLVSFLEGFVWNIEIVGCENLKKSEIMSFVNSNGLYEGVYSKSVDKDMLESLLMSSYEEIGWAHINEIGTTARVEISEAVKKPDVYDKKGANLKAKKDGVLVKAVAHSGVQKFRAGEGVVKGDVLASGLTVRGGKNIFTYASGEFIAEVKEKINIKVSRTQKYKAYYDIRQYKSLYFFGLDIPLYISKNTARAFDESEKTDYAVLNSKRLPLGIKTKTVKPYFVYERELDDSALLKLCEDETKRYISSSLSASEILNKSYSVSLSSDSATASGYVLCLEDIGEEVVIKY